MDYVQTGKRSLPGQNCREYCKKCRTLNFAPPPASLRTQSNRNGLGVLKNYVATENKDMTIKSVEELFRKRHAELKDQPEFWKKCVEKVKRIEEDYRKSDISVDIQVEKLCVELHPDSSSDSDEPECLSSETSDIES